MTIEGYNLLRADHPNNKKRGGVCIYYKEHLPVIKRDELCNLNECLVLEIRIGGEKCQEKRSPSQVREDFEIYCNLFLSNINDISLACSVITGTFNARYTKWWKFIILSLTKCNYRLMMIIGRHTHTHTQLDSQLEQRLVYTSALANVTLSTSSNTVIG